MPDVLKNSQLTNLTQFHKLFVRIYLSDFIFRESVFKWWVAVQGLNHNEVRSISEKVQEQPEYNSEKEKRVEFSVPSWMVS